MIDISKVKINPALLAMVPAGVALKQQIIPCTLLNDQVYVLSGNPSVKPEDLKSYFGKEVVIEQADPVLLREKLKQLYSKSSNQNHDQNEFTRLTDEILFIAISRGASDIHFNPGENNYLVRLRINGKLESYKELPQHVSSGIISRFKILAGMDISEKRSPQDGKFNHDISGTTKRVDIRAATIPSVYGEKMTLRLLGVNDDFDLNTLGMSKAHLKIYSSELQKSSGMILINGATGSGKSTSLYASLRKILQGRDVNIITVEDPVESNLEGVVQVNIDDSDKVTFPSALRSILRHDPDVIMVGEIRDGETAGIAIKSSLTGHLVLSSLHANSATSAVVRLADIGIEPYMIASTLKVSIAQKLVLRLCENCRKETVLTKDKAALIGNESLEGTRIYEKGGCLYCGGSGHSGRVAIFEMLKITDGIKRVIRTDLNDDSLRSEMNKMQSSTLKDDAVSKLLEGIIGYEECYQTISAI